MYDTFFCSEIQSQRITADKLCSYVKNMKIKYSMQKSNYQKKYNK